MTTDLRGVIPITATPFDAAGQVDEASIGTLVEFEARCGVHGLNVLGIMGEAHKLAEGERRRVAEVLREVRRGPLPGRGRHLARGHGGGGRAVAGGGGRGRRGRHGGAAHRAPRRRGDPRALPGGGGRDRDPRRRPGRAGHDGGPHVPRAPGPHRRGDQGVPLREARGAADAHEDHRHAAPPGRRRDPDLRGHERDVLLRGAVARRGRDHDGRGGARPPRADLHGVRAGRPRRRGGDLRPLRLLHPLRGPAGDRPRPPEGAPSSARRDRDQRRAPAGADPRRRRRDGSSATSSRASGSWSSRLRRRHSSIRRSARAPPSPAHAQSPGVRCRRVPHRLDVERALRCPGGNRPGFGP